MISKQEVQHIAKLARLGLIPQEIEEFQKEISSILDYIEKLKEVDVAEVEPTSHSIEIQNIMRDDELNKNLKLKNEKLIDLMPEKKNGYLKTKPIL